MPLRSNNAHAISCASLSTVTVAETVHLLWGTVCFSVKHDLSTRPRLSEASILGVGGLRLPDSGVKGFKGS